MLFLLVSQVFAQTLNSTLTSDCSTAAMNAMSGLAGACGGLNVFALLAANPLAGITSSASTSVFLGSFCSTSCSTALDSFISQVTPTCGSQVIVSDSGASALQYKANYNVENAIVCIKDSSSGYCLTSTILPALVISGYNVSNAATLSTAFVAFSLNKTQACTTCSTALKTAVNANIASFGTFAAIMSSLTSQITSTCASVTKSSASNFGVFSATAFLLAAFIFKF